MQLVHIRKVQPHDNVLVHRLPLPPHLPLQLHVPPLPLRYRQSCSLHHHHQCRSLPISGKTLCSRYQYQDCTVELQSGLDLRELRTKGETLFEVKAPPEEDLYPDENFDSEDVFKQLNRECLGEDEDNQDPSLTPFQRLAKKMEDVTPEKSGKVQKLVMRSGTGSLPALGVTASVHYNCYVEYSDEPYDSTRLRNKPEKVRLGHGSLIDGMDLAVTTMRQGELSKFLIHPDLAYGKLGVPPRIPGDATILMEIEILKFTDRAELEEFNTMSEEERKEISFKKKLNVVNTERREGNDLYTSGNHSKALSKYMRGLRILDSAHMRNEEEERQMRHVQVKLCLNISICALKLKQPERAIANCTRVLQIEPKNPKALFRKGQAYLQLGEFPESQRFMTRAQQLLPSDPCIAKGLQDLERSWKHFKALERNCYGKMFPEWKKDTYSTKNGEEKTRGNVTAEFQAMMREKLNTFQAMDNMVEMPIQAKSLTPAEITFLESVAKELGLKTQKKNHRGEEYVKITKPDRE
ncbi:inactive peptidyl-prolyl cis-trans isomerase FKBP6-like isoform X1 [Diadema setosum]|uniref:inactive peptidyl-prolyl cis-trans isomerase FKBP6-like isoform X1 n=1 Tax=Diadema setosum TaxID=31175 RepID=UPI003B3B6C95